MQKAIVPAFQPSFLADVLCPPPSSPCRCAALRQDTGGVPGAILFASCRAVSAAFCHFPFLPSLSLLQECRGRQSPLRRSQARPAPGSRNAPGGLSFLHKARRKPRKPAQGRAKNKAVRLCTACSASARHTPGRHPSGRKTARKAVVLPALPDTPGKAALKACQRLRRTLPGALHTAPSPRATAALRAPPAQPVWPLSDGIPACAPCETRRRRALTFLVSAAHKNTPPWRPRRSARPIRSYRRPCRS